MAGGALLQIAFAGRASESFYVSRSPQMSRWRVAVRKTTPYSIETFRLEFETKPVFSDTLPSVSRCRIRRHGDLLRNAVLTITLPDVYSSLLERFRWVPWLGVYLLRRASLLVDSQEVDTFYPDFEQILRTATEGARREAYDEMIGNVADVHAPRRARPLVTMVANRVNYTMYPDSTVLGEPSIRGRELLVPLGFFFSRDGDRAALPLIAMQLSEVFVEIELRPLNHLFQLWDAGKGEYGGPDVFRTVESFVKTGTQYPLELEASLTCEYVFLDDTERAALVQAAQTDYVISTVAQAQLSGITSANGTHIFRLNGTSRAIFWLFRRSDAFSRNTYPRFVREDAGGETMRTCGIMFNGVVREEEKPASFYGKTQPFLHVPTGRVPEGVYMYAFDPEPFAGGPSGTANLVTLDRVEFRVDLAMPDDPEVSYDMVVYSLDAAVFRVTSGQGGLVFA